MTIGSTTRDGLIAGGYPLAADEITITNATFMRGDVVGVSATGAYALVNSTASDGTQTPIGIITDDVSADAAQNVVTTMYIKGEFNQRFLRFGGTDTVDTHRRRMIEIGLIPRETRV